MQITITIKPNRASRFVGRSVKSLGAGVKGFKTGVKTEWQRLAPPPKAPAPTSQAAKLAA